MVVVISLWVTRQFSQNEWAEILTTTPIPIALMAVLYQIFRDNAAFERELIKQNENNDFILSATSHMANVAFDKHVEFAEKYLKAAQEELKKLRPVGQNGDIAQKAARRLFEVREEFGAWVTKEIREALEPFEHALLKFSAHADALEKHSPGISQPKIVEDFFAIYKKLKDVKDDERNAVAEEGETCLIENLQAILGIPDLTQLRKRYIERASRQSKNDWPNNPVI